MTLPFASITAGASLDGFAIHNLGSVEISGPGVKAIAVQSWNAKIIIGGEFTVTGGDPVVTRTNLARINPDGTLDATFNPPLLDGPVAAIAIQPDQGAPANPDLSRIIVGGSFGHCGLEPRKGVARFDSANGSLDPTFNPVTTDAPVQINAVVLQPDGMSILVGGSFEEIVLNEQSQNLARISVAAPDLGALTWGYSSGIDGEVNVILPQNGTILLGGTFQAPSFLLARLTGDGSLDAGFDDSFITAAPGGTIKSMALQADGKILIGGDFEASWNGTPMRTYLARLDRNGSHDASFNPDPNGYVASIVVQPDGKIQVAGNFTGIGTPSVMRNRLARLNIAGTLDSAFSAELDAVVNVIVRQPDGKLLAGGEFATAGGRPRTRLARFYPQGALDDDISAANLSPDYMVTAVSLHPDGMTTVAGQFLEFQGETRVGVARLKEDWNLAADGDFDPNLTVELTPTLLAHLADGSFLLGGIFEEVNGVEQKLLVKLDHSGDPNGSPELTSFNSNINSVMVGGTNTSAVQALAFLPRDTFVDGVRLEEGMYYVAGDLSAPPYRFLSRFKSDGTRDLSFVPAVEIDESVYAIAIQPDHKVLVGTSSGKILRLDVNGNLDVDLTPTPLNYYVSSIALQPDGGIIAAGFFNEPSLDNVWQRNILRFNSDGTRDETFNVEAWYSGAYPSGITRVAFQTDGSMLIYGSFDFVRDATGTDYYRDNIARIKPNGELDQEFDLGPFMYSSESPLGNLDTVHLQPDGKIILGGAFLSLDLGTSSALARVSNGWASEDLSVSSDGKTITWLRSGTGPELWGVTMEYSNDPDSGVWTPLGDAQQIAGGWRLVDQNLGAFGYNTNRYVRARGYVVGDKGSAGSWIESVRLYYLELAKTVITVNADVNGKTYGEDEPELTFTWSPALADGDSFSGSLIRQENENAGSYPIGQGTLALDEKYLIEFTGADFIIDPKPLAVTANLQSKDYGDADPALTYTWSPALIGTDSFIGVLGRVAGEDVGDHAITQGSLALGSNYALTFNTAPLTITAKDITVNANPQTKSYGDADPALTYTLSSALIGADSFSGSLQRAAGETVSGSPYAIQQGTLALNGNYSITFLGAAFNIYSKGATVSAASAVKTYGVTDPALSTASSGFLPDDLAPAKITFDANRDPGENAGSYPVRPTASDNGTGLLGNYAVLYHDGTLTIDKAPLVITADNKTKLMGAPDPELTASFDGLASFDSAASLGGAPLMTTVADAASAKGSYPIVASIGSIISANYDYSFVDGVLTVTGSAPQSITFDPLRPKTFGDGDFDPGATASSGLPVDYASATPGTAAVVGGKIRVLSPGTTDLTASQAGDEQYAAAPDVMRTLTVNPPPWNGLGFDGVDDVVRLEDATHLNFGAQTGFTIETWLHLDGSQPDGTGLVAKASGSDLWSGYQLILHQDRIAAEIGDATASFGVPRGLVGSASLNDGQWHHVAFSVDRAQATASLYLDGRLEAQLSDPAIGMNPDNGEPLRVGTDRCGSRFFKGEIDEVRLWDGARAQDRIRAAVSQIVDPLDEPQLAAYFHLDEGDVGLDNAAFPKAPERTAHAADGLLQGFALGGSGSNWIRSGAFLPLLETAPVSSISPNAATGGGVVYPNYYPATDVGLCWGTAPAPSLADSCSHSGSGTGPFAGALTGLTPGADYRVRAFATNRMGTAYGNEVTFQAGRQEQTINIGTITDKTYGDSGFYPGGTSTSGLPITYTSSNPEVAIVVNGEIQITGAGSSVITAIQGGDQSYNPAPEVALPFSVAKAPLRVTAQDKARAYLAPNPELTAACQGFVNGDGLSAISGAPALTTAALPESPAGNYPIAAAAGSLASRNYHFVMVDGVLRVAHSSQSISIDAITDKTYGDSGFLPGGRSTSGLPVTYTSSNPRVAIVMNGEIQITGTGSTVITASQGGDQNYTPAMDVSVPFAVAKAPLRVIAEDKSRAYLTPNPALTVSYQGFVKGEQVSVLSGATVLTTAASLASEAGNYAIVAGLGSLAADNYHFVPTNGTLNVFKSCQEITFPPIGERTFGDPSFEIVASACSGLDLSFTSSDPRVAQVNGNLLTITGAGSVVITATQGGTDDLDRALDKSQTVIVHKSGQGVSFSSLAQKVLGDPPFSLSATATSGLPVSYLSSDPGVAVISGNAVTIVGAGTTVISARQPGDGNYHAALPAAQPLTVALEGIPPVLSLSTLASGAVTSNPVLNIMGIVSDASGIASLTVNGADLTGQATLFSSAVPLAAGVNSVSVTARDGAGNRTTQTLSITHDALAPYLAVGTPADNSCTDNPIFTVSGSATSGSVVTLGINGGSLQLLDVADGQFTGTGYLEEGINTVQLSAALSGRTSRIKRSVTLVPGSPSVAITEPAQDIRTEQQSMTIRGRAGEQPGGSVLLEVDGTVFIPQMEGGAFQQQIALPRAGEVRITAKATDSGGQSSIARRNIIRIDRIIGDLNGNGSVGIQDASALLRISLGMEPATEQALARGDLAPLVNGVPQPDGKIDVGDLLVLLRRIVGLVDF